MKMKRDSRRWTVEIAIQKGVLEPAGDALFDAVESQTYRLAR
jgi:hypothetical protein